MTLAERLRAIVSVLPDGGAVTLPVRDLREWIAAEGEPQPAPGNEGGQEERWLTAEECSKLLNVSSRWCYDHASDLGGKTLTPRCKRFAASAVARFLARKR